MATRFSAQMSSHRSGCPAAMRVMSRNPPAARRSSAACSSARWSATVMSAAAVRWGTWLTTATSVSWRSGGRATTSAPRSDTIRATAANVVSAVSAVGVSTQTAPSNIAASAPSSPSSSDPAMGWPAQNRGSATAAAMGPLTLPTSVTTPVVPASARRTASGIDGDRGGDERDRRLGIQPGGPDHTPAPGRVDPGRVVVLTVDRPPARRQGRGRPTRRSAPGR